MSPRRSASHLARVAPNLTGSYALEFEEVCRLACNENHDKHVENLEREIRDRIVQARASLSGTPRLPAPPSPYQL